MKVTVIHEEEENVMLNKDRFRFRTFKIYKSLQNTTMANGDTIVYKKFLGRVTAITVPTDETKNNFVVDFAFCSIKDNYNKDIGKDIALTRLMDKFYEKKDLITINKLDGERVNDVIKEIILSHANEINWLRGVKKEDIV